MGWLGAAAAGSIPALVTFFSFSSPFFFSFSAVKIKTKNKLLEIETDCAWRMSRNKPHGKNLQFVKHKLCSDQYKISFMFCARQLVDFCLFGLFLEILHAQSVSISNFPPLKITAKRKDRTRIEACDLQNQVHLLGMHFEKTET